MNWMRIFRHALFVYVIWIGGSEETMLCRESQDIQYGGLRVDCSHSGISRVPDNIPANTTTLDLTFNNLTALYDGDFLNLINLRYLDISGNPICALESHSFGGLSALLVLEFNGHRLDYTHDSLPQDVFKPLHSLTNLSMRSDVSRFQQKRWTVPDKVIGSLTKLRYLNIDTDEHTIFRSGFYNLVNLREVIIGEIVKNGMDFQCGLGILTNETFMGLARSPITHLQLKRCSFDSLHIDSLAFLPHLQTASFDHMSVKKGNLSKALELFHVYKFKNMSSISLAKFRHDSLYFDTAFSVHAAVICHICLKSIDISDSRITLLDFQGLVIESSPIIRCIEHIKLSGNAIQIGHAIDIWFLLLPLFVNLQTVDISDQEKLYMADCTNTRHHFSPQHIPVPIPLGLPPKIKSINLGGFNPSMGVVIDIFFFGGQNLKFLNLSYCKFYDFNHTLVGIGNLEVLDLSNNDLSILSEKFFDTFPNLVTLRLSNSLLDNNFVRTNGKRLIKDLIKLQYLDLSKNNLVFLPYDLFMTLEALRVLDLSSNYLIAIPDLSTLANLQSIDMRQNSLTTISSEERNMLDRISETNHDFHLLLSGNTLSCVCDAMDFLLWLYETSVPMDGGNYSCRTLTGGLTYTRNVLNDWPSFYQKCISDLCLNLAIGGISLTFVALITAFVFTKNKMKIKLILLRMIGQNIYPRQRAEFLYDASIVYSDSLSSWVCNDVREELEINRGIKLNLRDRDHIPGRSQAHNIYEAIRDSWKIVVMLTEEFLESDLAYFTMCNCLSAITLTTPRRVIIAVENRMRIPTNVDFLLEAVPQSNIIEMTREPESNEIFYGILADAILTEDTNS